MVAGADAICFGLSTKGVVKGAVFRSGTGCGLVTGATAIFLELGTCTVVAGTEGICFGLGDVLRSGTGSGVVIGATASLADADAVFRDLNCGC